MQTADTSTSALIGRNSDMKDFCRGLYNCHDITYIHTPLKTMFGQHCSRTEYCLKFMIRINRVIWIHLLSWICLADSVSCNCDSHRLLPSVHMVQTVYSCFETDVLIWMFALLKGNDAELGGGREAHIDWSGQYSGVDPGIVKGGWLGTMQSKVPS